MNWSSEIVDPANLAIDEFLSGQANLAQPDRAFIKFIEIRLSRDFMYFRNIDQRI